MVRTVLMFPYCIRLTMTRPLLESCALLLSLSLGSFTIVLCHDHARASEAPKLLVISFSGFRYDYLHMFSLTNLKSFYEKGVRAEWLQPSFITDCAINHYTLVTGLYPESHGATLGDAYDPDTRQFLCGPKGSQTNEKKYAGEPIWETNLHKSSSIHWPYATNTHEVMQSNGSNLPPNATLREKFVVLLKWIEDQGDDEGEVEMEHTHGAADRHSPSADAMTSTNAMPASPNLALLYHSQPDETGHASGWNSTDVRKILEAIDKDFGDFISQLESRGLSEKINIIVLSDHGMADVVGDPIYLNDCLQNISSYSVMQTGPIASIWPTKGIADPDTLAGLKKDISTKGTCSRLAAYDGTNMPAGYHFRPLTPTNGIAPLILESPPGVPIYTQRSAGTGAAKGMHGWNNSWDAMKAIFLARGPAFRRGYVKKGFESIHVYELMCKLLGLKPAPNNGSLSAVEDLLSASAEGAGVDDHTTIFTELLVIVGSATVAGMFIVGACRVQRAIIRHAGGSGAGSRRLVGLPGVSSSSDSRRLLATGDHKQPLLGGAAIGSSDEESL